MADVLDSKTTVDKIKGYINERLSKPLKNGVDVASIVKKLKESRAKKGKK
jgi:hypothetical protein